MNKPVFDRTQMAELSRLISASLVEALAMPPAIALAADILACLHNLDGQCALCGCEQDEEAHLGDCPVNRHQALFELAARLKDTSHERMFPRTHVMAPLSPTQEMIDAGAKALEASRFGDPVEMVVMVVLAAALRALAPAFSLEMEMEQELKLGLGVKRSQFNQPACTNR